MEIVKQALAEAQEALMESREQLCNEEQSYALATRLLALQGLVPTRKAEAHHALKVAQLEFKVETIDLMCMLFEATATANEALRGHPTHTAIYDHEVEAFAAKLLDVQAARKAANVFVG